MKIVWFDLFLEARAEILKKFRWFFGPFEINWPLTCFSFSVEFVIYEILWCSKKSPFESFFPLENSSAFSSSACFSFKPRTSILRPSVLSYYNQSVQQKFKTLYKYFNESQNLFDLNCDAIAWNICTAFPGDCPPWLRLKWYTPKMWAPQ